MDLHVPEISGGTSFVAPVISISFSVVCASRGKDEAVPRGVKEAGMIGTDAWDMGVVGQVRNMSLMGSQKATLKVKHLKFLPVFNR